MFLAADSKPYNDFCKRLARELPAIVVSVDYRLAPEHPFPSAYDDGFDVLKFLDERRCLDDGRVTVPVNADLSRCFLAGDSAGGNISHHVALKVADVAAEDFKELKVIGTIAIQPFFGGEERTESEIRLVRMPVVKIKRTDWMWKAFLPKGSDRDHPSANVFGPKSNDISGVKFPATIVFIGGYDPLRDWQKRYYEGLKKLGKEAYLIDYSNAFHTFYAFPEIPESSMFIDEVRSFMQRQSNSSTE